MNLPPATAGDPTPHPDEVQAVSDHHLMPEGAPGEEIQTHPTSDPSSPGGLPLNVPQSVRDAWWLANVYAADKTPQLTPRAILFGVLIGMPSAVVSLYMILKFNQGFGVGMVAMLLAFLVFSYLSRVSGGRIRQMSVLENSACSSVASVAGYLTGGTVVAAFGAILMYSGSHVPWPVMTGIVFFNGLLGTCIAIPFKRIVINTEQLRFPSAVAGAVMLRNLYADSTDTVRKAMSMVYAMVLSGTYGLLRVYPDLAGAIQKCLSAPNRFFAWLALHPLIPSCFGEALLNPLRLWGMRQASYGPNFGIDPGVTLVAVGMIVGLRVSLTMMISAGLLYYVILPLMIQADLAHAAALTGDALAAFKPEIKSKVVDGVTVFKTVDWSLWAGAILMVVSSFVSMGLKWRTLWGALSHFSVGGKGDARDPLAAVEIPMSWFLAGMVLAGGGLIMTLHVGFGTNLWVGLLGVALAFVLSFICIRAAGETDWTPLGAMGKVMQVIYAWLPGTNAASIGAEAAGRINLASAGVAVTSADAATFLTYDLKTGYLLGQSPRQQFLGQLIGLVVGTIVVVPAWYLLVPNLDALTDKFNPVAAIIWSSVAKLLVGEGISALPHTVVVSLGVATAVGVIIPLLEHFLPKARPYLPSTIGIGLAMVLPFSICMGLGLGAILMAVWKRVAPKQQEDYGMMIASGLITGEALVMALSGILTAALAFGK